MVKLGVLTVFAGAIAALAALADNSDSVTLLAVGLVLAGVEVIALSKSAGGFTPAVLPLLSVNASFLSAPFLWPAVQEKANVSIRVAVSEDALLGAAAIGVFFCAMYTIGAIAGGARRVGFTSMPSGLLSPRKIPSGALVAFAYLAILLAVYAWQGALLQGRYLEANGPFWAVAASSSVGIPVAVMLLSLVTARPGPWRGLAFIGLGILFLIVFGRASRVMALFPGLILLGRATFLRRRPSTVSMMTAGLMTVLLLQLSLVGRGNPEGVGLLPLIDQLLERTNEVLSGFNPEALLGNFLISVPLTALVSVRPIDTSAFWIGVNPLPSVLTGWSQVRDSLSLNAYTPYNTLGELAAHGWALTAVFAAFAGFLISVSTRVAAKLSGGFQVVAALLVLAATTFFAVSVLQYNLRSSARLVWYQFFGVLALWFCAQAINARSESDKSIGTATSGQSSPALYQSTIGAEE